MSNCKYPWISLSVFQAANNPKTDFAFVPTSQSIYVHYQQHHHPNHHRHHHHTIQIYEYKSKKLNLFLRFSLMIIIYSWAE